MSTEQHPIIEQVKSQGRIRQEVSLVVQEELAIAGITETSFAELKEHAEALTDLQVVDKASLADVQAFLTKAGRMKTTIKQAIEPGKKWAHQLHKSYTSNENEFIATVEAIEEPLKAKKQAYLDRVVAEEAERQRQIEAMQEERKALIMGTGATFVPGPPAHKYVLGGTEVTVREVMEADHTTWTNLLRSFEMVAAELAEIKAEEERRSQEFQRQLDEQAKAQREAAAELERRQREIEEREAKMREAVNESRKNELVALGMTFVDDYQGGIVSTHGNPNEGLWAWANNLSIYSPDEYESMKDRAAVIVNQRNLAQQQAQEKAAHEALVQVRKERLLRNGYVVSVDGKGVRLDTAEGEVGGSHYVWLDTLDMVTEDDMERFVDMAQAELARRAAAHQEQLRQEAEAAARVRLEAEQSAAAKAEAERVAKMGDEERWASWVERINQSAPEMVSDEYRLRVSSVLYAVQMNDPTP